MGDKSGKRRPGRDGHKRETKTKRPRVLVVRRGEFWVSIDTHTGQLVCPAHCLLDDRDKNRVTAEVIAVLTKYGTPPSDPMDVRDAMFGRLVAAEV
jgi:hypothetical protein